MRIRRYSAGAIFLFSAIIVINVFTYCMIRLSNVDESMADEAGFPVVSIKTDNNSPVTSKEKYSDAKITFEGKTFKCKIRGRGNSTWDNPKKPYLVKFNQKISLLGLPDDDKWVFLTNATDNTALRNAYATYLAKNVFDRQKWVPDYRFVSLFLNGKYEGLYQIYEKISMEKGKLDLNQNESFMVVSSTRAAKVYNFMTKICHNFFSIYEPREPSPEKAVYIEEKLNELEESIFSSNFLDSREGYKARFDLDSLIDWYLINEFTTNRDARLRDSCYIYFDSSDQKFYMGPSWDFDISCGNNSYEGNSTPDTLWVKTEGNWFARFYQDEDFEKAVKERYFEVHDRLVESIEWLRAQTESRQMNIAKKYDDRVWRTIGNYQWPHAPGWHERKTYQAECEYLLDWLTKRIQWLDSEFSK